MSLLQKTIKNCLLALFSLVISGALFAGCVFIYMYLELPDVTSLKNMQLQVPLRVYTRDEKLIAEYGEDHRIPVPLHQVPKKLIQAVLATEDQRYFEHPGVDFIGIIRASREVLLTGRPSQGASTITMQVARNFFLTRQKTIGRKFNEVLLALKIDASLSKEKVLELYLNKIYLGQRTYGVAAAAQVYYGKKLKDLNLPEIAVLAGLPQAPSRDNPIDNPGGALERRNHVLERMLTSGYITQKEFQDAVDTPITTHLHTRKSLVNAPYVGEMVRAAMVEAYGDGAYTNGLKVYTTIDSHLQEAANNAVRNGLMNYDRRHGYRGAEKHLRKSSQWLSQLQQIPVVNNLNPAVIITTRSGNYYAMLGNGKKIVVSNPNYRSARLKSGDVIRVIRNLDRWELTQVPRVEGALASISPTTGEILAVNGGFSFAQSSYNRATQARRQPGSSFKPFVYSAALEKGFTLSSIVMDAPIEQYIPGTNKIWRPQNSNLRFYGPMRLRLGLVHSRNMISIRILEAIGVSYAIDYATRFGFDPSELPRGLTLALGTGSVTPIQLASGYATFANGGYRINPYFIDHITDDHGKVLYQAGSTKLVRTISAENAYLMNSVLQDVIRFGTGKSALALNRKDIAGKTGTTNDQNDGWFAGYNGDVVTTVWVGYDQPKSLHEYGANAALPIWVEYMKVALNGKPEHTLSQPPDIVQLPIDPQSGSPLNENQGYAVYEYFDKSHLPGAQSDDDSQGEGGALSSLDNDNDQPSNNSDDNKIQADDLEKSNKGNLEDLRENNSEESEELFHD